MTSPIHTLLLVDNFDPDRELYRRYLQVDSSCAYRLLEADSVSAGLELCRNQEIDVILLDYALPDADGLMFLEALHEQSNGSSPPVVMVTGEGNEQVAVKAMKLGAKDYLIKNALTAEYLQESIKNAIRSPARESVSLQAVSQQITTIWESMTDAYVTLDCDWRIVYVNSAAEQIFHRLTGLNPDQFLGRTHWEIFPWSVGTITEFEYRRAMAQQSAVHFEFHYEPTDSWFEIHGYPSSVGLGIYFRDISDRKQIELERQQLLHRIQASEQRFRELFNTSYQFMGVLDLEGTLLEVNQSALESIGVPASAIVGQKFWQTPWWTHSEPLQEQLKSAIVAAAGGAFVRYEVTFPNAEGAPMTTDFSLKPVLDEQGKAVMLIGEGHDITERIQLEAARQRAERSRRESEERLKLGIQVAGLAIARFDYATNSVSLSPEAAKLYGIAADECASDGADGCSMGCVVSRDRIHATFHPEERTMLEEIIQQVLDPNGTGWFALDHRVVWPNGEVRWLSVRKQVFFDRDAAKPNYAILGAIDITDRKRVAATVQEQLAQIKALYITAPVGLCFLDREYRFIQINERLAEINGLSVSEHLGRKLEEILPELAEAQAPIFEQVLETGLPVLDIEVQGTTPAHPGVIRYWSTSYYPLLAAGEQQLDKRVLGINVMVQEITERKRAELERAQLLQEAQAARAEAEAANRSKDDFVAIIAHELRSPLNSISGWTQIMQSRKLDEAATAKALATIARNTQAQVQLVEDLLDISRMARKTLQLTLASVSGSEIIESALNLVRPMAEAKQIQIETHLTQTPNLSGDFNRLQQVLVNLLTNAIKFTPSQGRVDIWLEPANSQVQMRICDTGKGITPDMLPKIFEQFQQGQSNTGSNDGLGLGLAIVKN